MSTQQDIADALRTVAGVAQAAAPVMPEPFAIAARILGAAAGAASVAIDAGKSEAEVVAAIHRIRSIDTSETDAAVDARVAAKPSREEAPDPDLAVVSLRALRAAVRETHKIAMRDGRAVLVALQQTGG